jgi:hypothetical protein
VTLTVAPVTTAPVASVTTPLMVPNNPWAATRLGPSVIIDSAAPNTAMANFALFIISSAASRHTNTMGLEAILLAPETNFCVHVFSKFV